MNAQELIDELKSQDIILKFDGGHLKWDAPEETGPNDQVIELIRQHYDEIIEHIGRHPQPLINTSEIEPETGESKIIKVEDLKKGGFKKNRYQLSGKPLKKGGVKKDRFEWSSKSWNPITGCNRISAGCKNCYAEKFATRLKGKYGYPADQPFRPGVIHEDKFEKPFKWRKPNIVFVCSMGDLFHEAIPDDIVQRVLDTCRKASHHRFVVLTKRPDRLNQGQGFNYPNNVWLGVSVENQRWWNERTKLLREVDAPVRIVSIEPILEPVILDDISWCDWVMVGKETGQGARLAEFRWFTDIYRQCQEAGVPFFSKQEFPDGRIFVEYPFKPL